MTAYYLRSSLLFRHMKFVAMNELSHVSRAAGTLPKIQHPNDCSHHLESCETVQTIDCRSDGAKVLHNLH